MRKPGFLYCMVGAVSATLLLAGCDKDKSDTQKKVQAVSVVTLKAEPYTQTLSLPGRTTAFETSPVTPQITGIIQKRLFTEGGEVTAGQVLYQIDPAPYQATYDQDKATLAQAQAALLSARPTAERDVQLAKIDAISKETLETAQATLKADQATIEADQAALESARINLDYTKVRAPISGTISESTYTPGALVTADQTTALATIYSYDPMYVDVTQSSAQVLQWRRALAKGTLTKDTSGGAKIQLTLEDGSTYDHTGSLQFAGVGVDETTGTITLRAIVPNPQKLLLPGMYVHATVVQGINSNAVMVPQQAVSHDSEGNATVLLVNDKNQIQQQTITVDGTDGAYWVSTGGVQAGQRVVVAGSQYVQAGQTVQPQAVTLPAPPSATAASNAPATPDTGSTPPKTANATTPQQ